MKKTSRRILIAAAITLVLVLSITGVVMAAGPNGGNGTGDGTCPNPDCPNDGVCQNDGVCPNDGICQNDGECPNDGVCPNDCDGDRTQTRNHAQTCNGTANRFQYNNRINADGTGDSYQYARMWRHMFGMDVEG